MNTNTNMSAMNFQPKLVKELIQRLLSKQSERQKTEMCFDSQAYSLILHLDQDYELIYNMTFPQSRKFKITLQFTRNGIHDELSCSGTSKTEVETRVFHNFNIQNLSWLNEHYPSQFKCDAQMDSTSSTEQGPDTAEGEKQINTIMTREVPLARNKLPITLNQGMLDRICCGQEAPQFPIWQDRKILLSKGTISINDSFGTPVQSWIFPRDLYKLSNTPVNRPFEQFMFTKPNIDFTLKINAQKFSTGRYLLSYVYEPLTMHNTIDLVQIAASAGALGYASQQMRDHVMIDLGESNEGNLQIAFRNKCPFTTSLVNNQESFRGACNVMVILTCLSPMRVIEGAPTSSPYSVFVSAKDTKFIGMRYAVTPADAQMGNSSFKDVSKSVLSGAKSVPVIGGLVGGIASSIGHFSMALQKPFQKPEVVSKIEEDLKYIGLINNRDKPTNINDPQDIRPNATGNLAVGTNIAENSLVMRLDPTATCVNISDHVPEMAIESVHDLLRVWSLSKIFEWNMTDVIDKELFSDNAMPGWTDNTSSTTTTVNSLLDGFASFYTYYHGEVEYRFDFICNQFHTGIVTIAYIPYHDNFSAAQATSGYWKIVDLREQKSFNFTIPYINNTVCRLTQGASVVNNYGFPVPSPGSIKVFVSNPLNPISSAPSTIQVLVYKRAAPNFRYSYPKFIRGNQIGGVSYSQIAYGIPPAALLDAQMEDGEKENVDETPDFPLAMNGGLEVQTFEDHMNIKDLMRRYIGQASHTIPAGTTWLVPVTLWNTRRDGYPRTIQQFIQRQFRYYRGSIKLMFVIESTTPAFVYFTHMPQSNLCHYGAVPDSEPTVASSIHFQGMATQLAVTQINPVVKIEVPFHGVYDYLDCQYAIGMSRTSPTTSVIDRVAQNLGHIAIRSNVEVTIKQFIAMADDGIFIKPSYHLGVNNAYNRAPSATTLRLDRNPADAQMDDEEEINDPIMQGLTGPTDVVLEPPRTQGFCHSVYNRITNSMVDAVSPITNTFSAMRNLPRIEARFTGTMDKMESALEYIKDAAHGIVNGIKNSLSWVTNVGAIFNSVLHFLQALINPKWESFCIAITGIFVSIGCFASDFTTRMMDFFLSLRPSRTSRDHRTEELAEANCEHDNCSTCRNECDPRCSTCRNERMFTDESISSLVALMFASVSAWLGWKGEGPSISIAKGLFNVSTNFWKTIHQSSRFITHLVTLLKRIFKYIAQKSGLGTAAITLTEQNNSVTNFISEALLMLDERNIRSLETDAGTKYRFWYCVAAAHQMIVKFTGSTLPESNSVIRLAYKVIEKGNQVAVQSMACPVRYEPFVLGIEGPSKIGKSFMLQEMLPALLASDAYNIRTHAPPVFVRTPGVQFWNSYTNQPCILYDDFLAVLAPEVAVPQVTELYNLKSSAQFNLNMASIEDKKLLGNPFIVALSCNNAFVTLNGTTCKEAFLRRKEHLWRVELKPEFQGDIRKVPEDIKESFDMYDFYRYVDPADPMSKTPTPISYQEWYDCVKRDATAYHLREQRNVCKRLEGLKKLLPTTARNMMHEVDPFRIFYAAYTGAADVPGLTQGGLLPSELLRIQLDEMANMPENGGAVVNLAGEVVTEGTPTPPSAQMNFNILPTKMVDFIKGIMYVEDPNSPTAAPQLYDAVGECVICNEEKPLVYGCNNNHKCCDDCNTGMWRAFEDNNEIAYRCGVCRASLYRLLETPTEIMLKLRPLVWARNIKNRMSRVGSRIADYYDACFDFVNRNPNVRRIIIITLAAMYISGLSYLRARTDLASNVIQDQHTLMWADDDDMHPFSYITNWGPIFYASRDWLPRREWRNVMYPATANMDDDQFLDAEAGPSWLAMTQHPEISRFIDEILPLHPVTTSSCRHINLVRMDVADIFYEVDESGLRFWDMGIYNAERVYDAPCQHENCLWKDTKTRFNFINKWAHKNNQLIVDRKRDWDRTHGDFKLPYEFISRAALTAATVQRNALTLAVEQYRRRTWWEWCTEKWQKYGKFVKLGLAIASGIASFVGAFRFVKSLITPDVVGVDSQLVNSGSFNTRRIARTTVRPRQTADANLSEEIEARSIRAIEKNTIFLVCTYSFEGVKTTKRMRGFGLFGRTYLIPGHYGKYLLTKFNKAKTGEITDLTLQVERFVSRDCICDIKLDEKTFRFSNNDLAYGVTPPEFPMFKDISNYVPTVEQHAHIGGEYLHVECETNQQRITAIPGQILGLIDRQRVRGTQHWEEYDIFDAYATTYGKSGSCGSILVANINAPLFAIHVAGHNNNPHNTTGYSLPLIREDIEDLKKGTTVLSYWTPELLDPADAHMQLQGTIMPVGAVKKNMVSFMPKKTKIIPSLLQGQIYDINGIKIPTVTEPGILSPRDNRYNHDMSPLYHGCMKHTLPPKRFDQDQLDYCIDQISSELNKVLIPMRNIQNNLSYKDSIVGFNDLEYYDSIDLNTSAGWPWNLNEKKVKKDFIKVVRDRHSKVISCEIDEGLLAVMERNRELREQGIRPFTVFLDWLKDERRKEKKLLLKDGTRIFSLCPMDLLIQLRQFTLDFSASFMKYRERTESAVGIVVDGPEWSRLANKLLCNSPNIITGDFSDFGPRLASQVVRAAFEIIKRWYKHNNKQDDLFYIQLDVMCEEIANANHIMHDFIYQVLCGAPSGSPLTVIINTLANMLYTRYVWFTIFPNSDPKEYHKNVIAKFYGDDAIISINPTKSEQFNCQTISLVLKDFDIIYSDAGKSGTEKYTTIDKATFLKSGFKPHPDYQDHWLSPLEKTSIYECAQWVWKSNDLTYATNENAEQSLRLAYGHGPDFFFEWRKCLNRALQSMRLGTLSLTWKHVDKQFFDQETVKGVYTVCSRFDDGLGLNAFTNAGLTGLKEEIRARRLHNNVINFLTGDLSNSDESMAKGDPVAYEE